MKVDIIIPAHNRCRVLDRTLASLVAQEYDRSRFSIIVADNCSTDDTRAVVEGWQRKASVPIAYYFEKRPGVHYARNSAAFLAGSEWLYYTDDDMQADPQMLRSFADFVADWPRVVCAMGKVLPTWEATPPAWVLRFCNNANLSLQHRPEEVVVSSEDPGVYSCHELIRKDALLACGGFRPENTGGTWVGDGETGLSIQLRAQGRIFGYTAKALTHHIIPPERLTQKYFEKRLANQGAADAFTQFNREKIALAELPGAMEFCWRQSMKENVRALRCGLTGNANWRQHRAQAAYWKAKRDFFANVLADGELRAFVSRKEWMSDCGGAAGGCGGKAFGKAEMRIS